MAFGFVETNLMQRNVDEQLIEPNKELAYWGRLVWALIFLLGLMWHWK